MLAAASQNDDLIASNTMSDDDQEGNKSKYDVN